MSRFVVSTAVAALISATASFAGVSSAYAQTPLLSPVPVAYNWSGFYFGVFGGWAWTDVHATDLFTDAFGGNFYTPGGNPYDLSADGLLAGAQAGYDWQWNRFVVGIAGEVGYMDLNGKKTNPWALPVPGTEVLPYTTVDGGWYGALTGRVGVPFNRFLIYARGGVAFLDAHASTIDPCGRSFCGQTKIEAFGDEVRLGWTAGGGLEAALTERLHVGVEYRFYDFESFEVSGVANNFLEYHQDVEFDGIHTARAFVNYVW